MRPLNSGRRQPPPAQQSVRDCRCGSPRVAAACDHPAPMHSDRLQPLPVWQSSPALRRRCRSEAYYRAAYLVIAVNLDRLQPPPERVPPQYSCSILLHDEAAWTLYRPVHSDQLRRQAARPPYLDFHLEMLHEGGFDRAACSVDSDRLPHGLTRRLPQRSCSTSSRNEAECYRLCPVHLDRSLVPSATWRPLPARLCGLRRRQHRVRDIRRFCEG